MFNATIAGHLGKDPEVRFTPSGQKVTSFTVATNHRKGNEDVTIWVRVTVWGDRFDKKISFLKKGSAVIVTGRMNPPSSYTDKEGRVQFTLELTAEMLDFSPFGKGDRMGGAGEAAPAGHQQQQYHNYEESFQGGGAGHSRSSYSHAGQNHTSHASANTTEEDTLPF